MRESDWFFETVKLYRSFVKVTSDHEVTSDELRNKHRGQTLKVTTHFAKQQDELEVQGRTVRSYEGDIKRAIQNANLTGKLQIPSPSNVGSQAGDSSESIKRKIERTHKAKTAVVDAISKHTHRNRILRWLIALVALAILVLGFVAYNAYSMEMTYRSGINALESGNLDEALTYFQETEGYKQSEDEIALIRMEMTYRNGVNALESGNLEDALAYFQKTEGYKQSDEEITYIQGSIAYSESDLEEAAEQFEYIGGHRDTDEILPSIYTQLTPTDTPTPTPTDTPTPIPTDTPTPTPTDTPTPTPIDTPTPTPIDTPTPTRTDTPTPDLVSGLDEYENNNSSRQAKIIRRGQIQTHSIFPAGDEDWLRFTLDAPSGVTLETSGTNGDTYLYLFNDEDEEQIDSDDDGGNGAFSLLDRSCNSNPLPAGTYYAAVTEFNEGETIERYSISLDTITCATRTPTNTPTRRPTSTPTPTDEPSIEIVTVPPLRNGNSTSLRYQAHVQRAGWTDWIGDGQLAGRVGSGSRIEAIRAELINPPSEMSICYHVYVEGSGWQDDVCDGDEAGTIGRGLRVEAVVMQLVNAPPNVHLCYQAHIQREAWSEIVCDTGDVVGFAGQGLLIESFKAWMPSDIVKTRMSVHKFSNGEMYWLEELDQIYVHFSNGVIRRFRDNYVDGDTEDSCPDLTVNNSGFKPLHGFGLIWCTRPEIRTQLGEPISWSTNYNGTYLSFQTKEGFTKDNLAVIEVRK